MSSWFRFFNRTRTISEEDDMVKKTIQLIPSRTVSIGSNYSESYCSDDEEKDYTDLEDEGEKEGRKAREVVVVGKSRKPKQTRWRWWMRLVMVILGIFLILFGVLAGVYMHKIRHALGEYPLGDDDDDDDGDGARATICMWSLIVVMMMMMDRMIRCPSCACRGLGFVYEGPRLMMMMMMMMMMMIKGV